MNALEKQIAGDHYRKMKIQPAEFIHANDIGFLAGCAIKYCARYKVKNGKEDLLKAIHFLELLIQLEYPPPVYPYADIMGTAAVPCKACGGTGSWPAIAGGGIQVCKECAGRGTCLSTESPRTCSVCKRELAASENAIMTVGGIICLPCEGKHQAIVEEYIGERIVPE